ncbi:hypothetical protein [Nocardioides solisilvae]|uniref:hypothetical protein n=1 Tax=Nocardioides solisilvae TaxID=1542435 RepID=UPI000D74DE27|nr:hypothetical protein [Nocardioides solisilvae]
MKSSAVFLAVIAFVLGLWGWSRWGGEDGREARPPQREVAVAVDATIDPLALPLHLPVSLPDGFGWVGEAQREHRDGEVVAATTAFQAASGDVVSLCAAPAADPTGCRPEGAIAGELERRVGDHVVLVRPVRGSFASAEQRRFWERVDLVADPALVPWLPASSR